MNAKQIHQGMGACDRGACSGESTMSGGGVQLTGSGGVAKKLATDD